MIGKLIDVVRFQKRRIPTSWQSNISLVETDFGKLRVLDTQGQKPVIISVPDGPNVIEHHENLIEKLSKNFRVICFELPGVGFSFPTMAHDYSLERTAKIVLNVMDILKVEKAALAFSCGNGFYAIKATEMAPERFSYLFLTQTPSFNSLKEWTNSAIPKFLTYPFVGQLMNSFLEKKLAKTWYKVALPRETDGSEYELTAIDSLKNGGCFCLAGLVQGLSKENATSIKTPEIPSVQIWGKKDFSHRKTDNKTILEHLPNCEIIEFENCGHFPELEDTDNYVKLIKERLVR